LIWFTIATEIAIAVCDKPDKYENLFTKTPGQKQALVISQTPSDPDFLDAFIQLLHEKVPLNIDIFMPKFSNSDKEAVMAIQSAFL